MKAHGAQRVVRAFASIVMASLMFAPLARPAAAASNGATAGAAATASVVQTAAAGAATPLTIPSVSLDPAFAPLPRGSRSPWDNEVVLDGIDGLTYNTPGTEVKVRAMSSNAFFVDEVWLVYPRVQYLFDNKVVPDPGGALGQLAFSTWVSVGTFPPGTEIIFGFKTGVGIDDKCLDRTNLDASVDQHHCYSVRQDPSFVPLAPDPLRSCSITDDACRNKAWPSQTPDGRSIYYTGPGVRNVKDNSPHGRFQYLTNDKPDGTGNALTNTALFGLEDVGAPLQTAGVACPFPPSPASPAGCLWHPDFQDGGVVVWPALAATCSATATKNVVAITGQVGFGTVKLRDSFTGTVFPQTFAPGDQITFTPDASTTNPPTVTGASPNWSITLHGQALMAITDPNAPATIVDQFGATIANPNKTLDAGVCFDPTFPPLPTIRAVIGTVSCDAGWDFTISSVDANSAPPSIRVSWTNDQVPPADEVATIPLTSVGADGVAHYRSTLNTTLRVVSATTNSPTATWAGAFSLQRGPCPELKTADITTACPVVGATQWDLTITATTQAQAPAKISVTWQGGSPTDVLLSGAVVGGVAHYTSTANLTRPITAATAMIQGAWAGAFKVNGSACPGAKHLSLTTVPPCVASVSVWDFTISNVTTPLAPASISATWTGQTSPEPVALTGTVGIDGIAHYTTTSHTGAAFLALVSASADLTFATQADAAAFAGALSLTGAPCPPPPPSTPPPSPSPCVTPSKTPRPTPTRTPSPSPKPATGGGTNGGSRNGTGSGSRSKDGARANGGVSNGGRATASNAGTKGGTRNGSASGTHSRSKAGTKAGTKDGSKTCPKPPSSHGSPSPRPSVTPKPASIHARPTPKPASVHARPTPKPASNHGTTPARPTPTPTPKPATNDGRGSTTTVGASAPQPVQIVKSEKVGGSRVITLRIPIPGTPDFRTITVTIPDR